MKRPRNSTLLALAAISISAPLSRSEFISPTNNSSSEPANLMIKLSSESSSGNNAPQIPLIGLGLGNVPHNRIPFILATAMDSKSDGTNSNTNEQYRLVDTSHTNPALEVLVGRSLTRLLSTTTASGSAKEDSYHVIIKIWHTHLGYDRTMTSVHDSLSDILPGGLFTASSSNDPSSWKKDARVKVHAVIQYPRCYDTLFTSKYYLSSPNFPVKYENCHEEEEAFVKTYSSKEDAAASPLEDKLAWKRSYRALEELYHRGILESIGVSNFGPSDMKLLYEYASVGPHLYMGTLHTLLEGEEMVEELVKHGVHYVCYDAVSALLEGKEGALKAYQKLERMGATHGVTSGDGDGNGYSAVQIVLGWLIQRGVGVVPGTTDTRHLLENSPQVLSTMPKFSPREVLDVEMTVQAVISGEDVEEDSEAERRKKQDVEMTTGTDSSEEGAGVVATFFNSLKRNVRIFKVHPTTGRQIQLSSSIAPGRSGRIMVDVNDVLIAYDGHGTAVKKFLVEADEGVGRVDFAVEL